MSSHKTNPAPEKTAAGLGSVICLEAFDSPNIAPVEAEANRFVSEMHSLGATFSVTRTGADVQWVYTPPAGMREPLRQLKASFNLTRPGTREAIVQAILRHKYPRGAP